MVQFCFAEGIQFFNNFVPSSWNSEDGLPGNSVTDIVQDTKGYIYIGTYEGLVRFDGIEFTVINKKYDKKYNFVSARSLFIDSRGNLWNGSNDEGVFCIGKDDSVRKFSTLDGLPNNSIRDLCEDREGNIWVGTSSGIALISPEGKVFIPEGLEDLIEDNNILVKHLFCDSAGRIWICTALQNRLYVYSGRRFSVYDGITSIKNPSVNYVTQDSAGAFWFGVSPYYLLKKNGEEETLFDGGGISQKGTVVNCIFHDSVGNVWFSTDTGLGVISGGEISYYTEKQGLVDDKVVKIMEDRESNIWIGTDRGGIEKLSQSQFRIIKNNETINAVVEDTFRKVIWLASDKGVRCYDQKKFIENPLTEYCENIRVRDINITDAGDVLVSTYAQLGVIKYTRDGKIISWTEKDGLTGNRTRCTLLHSGGDLYIATTNGLNIVKGFSKDGEIITIQKSSEVSSDFIMTLHEDSEGNVWCGTDGGGIFVVDSKTYEIKKTYTTEDGLAGNIIFKISEPVPGQKWICTGTGLSVMKEDSGSLKIYNFNSGNGLGTDGVFQALIDYTETVWFTSNKGIFSVHYRDFENVFNGKDDSIFSKFYGRSDGIVTAGVTSTSKSSKDSFGRLWFTLVDGVAFYDPVRGKANTKAPIVQIQEISIDDENFIYDGSPVEIGPDSKRLSIKFTGLSFISSEQVKFSYKLEGYDSKFSEWTTQRNVSYTNLPHGTYKFTVFAMTRDEVKSLPSYVVTIIKKPYIWNLLWFRLLIGGIIVLATAALIFYRYKDIVREQKRNKEFTSQVISALVVAIDAKDQYTNGHSNRVSKYAVMIARKAGKSEAELERIFYAGLLHDVGKIGVPDSIISKPDKLTGEEFEVIKTHPVIGSEILKSITAVPEVVVGARWHHERWDGRGYPDGLKETGIPEVARIIGVADAYDAMTSDRSYRRHLTQSVVREQIEKGRGSQFDPVFATIMLEIIDDDVDFKLHE
ncbi:ligand-binding sensor domain-containing protein [Treponema rectale]|nr:HD domain-containing phosphohydrolase [Treponema rectale]MBB5220056.1 ligand-binding sensor domain-containing protein [Treponema rectale]